MAFTLNYTGAEINDLLAKVNDIVNAFNSMDNGLYLITANKTSEGIEWSVAPSATLSEGTYTLKYTVPSSGTPTISWVAG